MGEFDDVLAIELGDEWDEPSVDPAGSPPIAPPILTLRVPGAVVELHGEVPPEVVTALGQLDDPRLRSGEVPRRVTLHVERTTDGWRVTGPIRTSTCDRDGAALIGDLVHRLDEMVLAADRGEVHLEAACVSIDGRGVLVVAASGTERAAVTDALLARGASLVSRRILTLLPGSHTVFGYPAPAVRTPVVRPHTPISPWAMPEVVVHLDDPVRGATDGGASADPLRTAESCRRLMAVAIDRSRFGPATVEVVASLAANASHWQVAGPDPGTVAEAIRSLEPPARREVVVTHRFDAATSRSRGATRDAEGAVRVACFDEGAVLVSATDDQVVELTVEECAAIEELLVTPAPSARHRRPDPRLERLGQLGLGDAVRVLSDAPRRATPGPESYGLPNCPIGETTRRIWADTPLLREPDGGGAGAGADGLTALAVLRGALPADDAQRDAAMSSHQRIQDEVVTVERTLLHALDVLAGAGLDPLVLGSVVVAHDGPLPAYFAVHEQADLLVHDGQLRVALRALLDAGFETVGSTFGASTRPTYADHPAHDDRAAAAADGGDRGAGGAAADGAPTELVDRDDLLHGTVELRAPGADRAGAAVDAAATVLRVRDTLGVGPFGSLVDHEEFHRRSVPMRLHRRWFRTLHPEHRFVHACVQLQSATGRAAAQLQRDVVLTVPVADTLLAEAMEASERWGATAAVTDAVRRTDDALPGLPAWIVGRARRDDSSAGRGRRRRR